MALSTTPRSPHAASYGFVLARKIGAARVGQNVPPHIEDRLQRTPYVALDNSGVVEVGDEIVI